MSSIVSTFQSILSLGSAGAVSKGEAERGCVSVPRLRRAISSAAAWSRCRSQRTTLGQYSREQLWLLPCRHRHPPAPRPAQDAAGPGLKVLASGDDRAFRPFREAAAAAQQVRKQPRPWWRQIHAVDAAGMGLSDTVTGSYACARPAPISSTTQSAMPSAAALVLRSPEAW